MKEPTQTHQAGSSVTEWWVSGHRDKWAAERVHEVAPGKPVALGPEIYFDDLARRDWCD